MELFATAAKGTEELLAAELARLGEGSTQAERGGVAFEGSLERAYRVCLWSRIASRVLLPIARFDAPDEEALYAGVRAIRWTEHATARETIAVDAVASHSAITNERYAALKCKDAIVDAIRDKQGSRPDVDTKRPDVRVHVHLREDRATVSIDLAGGGMHRRGLGRTGAAAPLKENLAAAILALIDWPARLDRGEPLVDPMCGSATLLIEAAMLALDIAPGLRREHHGFVGWRGHDDKLFQRLLREARERKQQRHPSLALFGWDESATAIRAASDNARRAEIEGLSLAVKPLGQASAPPDLPAGALFANPPYGERLGETGELGPLYEQLGDTLRRKFPGYTGYVLTGNAALAKRIGLRAARRIPLFNGPIETRLFAFPISDRAPKEDVVPHFRRPSAEAEMFRNRLAKNQKRLGRWATRSEVTCFRLYDADIPEYNVAVDRYGDAAVVQEYARPRGVDPERAETHLRDVLAVVPEVLGIERDAVVLKVRRRRGPEQYEKLGDRKRLREVKEGGLRFLVNLDDYLDTGLFLDHRLVRAAIREHSEGHDVLNLFAYTCTASVYAAAGRARTTTSVDLSNTYLEWGEKNLALNGFGDRTRHSVVRADVIAWMRDAVRGRKRYGLVFLAPPFASRSKAMRGDFELARDHVALIRDAMSLLTSDGELWFSAPIRTFTLEQTALQGIEVEDVTDRTTSEDFKRTGRGHRTFRCISAKKRKKSTGQPLSTEGLSTNLSRPDAPEDPGPFHPRAGSRHRRRIRRAHPGPPSDGD